MAISDLVYIDEAGFHFPDYPTVLSYLQESYRSIYGSDVYLNADSQDGQWIAIIAQAIYDSMAVAAAVFNSFSPATGQGTGLSRNVKINGITRRAATFSTVDLTVVGQAGTVIQNGQVQDTLGQKWNLPTPVIIPVSGSITVTATADVSGAVKASANTVNQIYTPTLGWQTVTNPLAATVGVAVETDAELRQRQQYSTALPSRSIMDGTIGAMADVSGVIRYRGYENDTGTDDVNGIPGHSISMVVDGGDSQAIAEAIARHKTPGTGTFGTTSEVVYDQYNVPNTINFYRPTTVAIKAEVKIKVFTGYTAGYAALIQQAVANSINSLGIGDDVLFTKLYVPANLPATQAGTTFNIQTVKIARGSDSVAAEDVAIAFNEAAECSLSDVTVTVVP